MEQWQRTCPTLRVVFQLSAFLHFHLGLCTCTLGKKLGDKFTGLENWKHNLFWDRYRNLGEKTDIKRSLINNYL